MPKPEDFDQAESILDSREGDYSWLDAEEFELENDGDEN